jgi:hypothetical protein
MEVVSVSKIACFFGERNRGERKKRSERAKGKKKLRCKEKVIVREVKIARNRESVGENST